MGGGASSGEPSLRDAPQDCQDAVCSTNNNSSSMTAQPPPHPQQSEGATPCLPLAVAARWACRRLAIAACRARRLGGLPRRRRTNGCVTFALRSRDGLRGGVLSSLRSSSGGGGGGDNRGVCRGGGWCGGCFLHGSLWASGLLQSGFWRRAGLEDVLDGNQLFLKTDVWIHRPLRTDRFQRLLEGAIGAVHNVRNEERSTPGDAFGAMDEDAPPLRPPRRSRRCRGRRLSRGGGGGAAAAWLRRPIAVLHHHGGRRRRRGESSRESVTSRACNGVRRRGSRWYVMSQRLVEKIDEPHRRGEQQLRVFVIHGNGKVLQVVWKQRGDGVVDDDDVRYPPLPQIV